jgi:hypothetical protein
MQVESALTTWPHPRNSSNSIRGRPPLPQGPRIPTRSFSTGNPTIDSLNPAILTFSPPAMSFGAVSELAENASSWQSQLSTMVSSSETSPRPSLTPPPSLAFDPAPLPFKGLSLSAAEWTFTSRELQEIVSRAIKLSARESYIRLLSLSTLDDTLPQEILRLESLKMVTQAKYRFHVHRRTMLLQALSSASLNNAAAKCGLGHHARNNIGDGNNAPKMDNRDPFSNVSKLTSQLSETTGALDVLATDLITIASHQSQITALLATHWGSALAIALRKLNSSYGRRTRELKNALQRVSMLEAEVAEAWIEADRLAGEMDALEKFADSIQVQEPPPKPSEPIMEEVEEPDVDFRADPDVDLTGKFSRRMENEDLTDLLDYADEAVIETASVVLVPRGLHATSEPTTPIFGQLSSKTPPPDFNPGMNSRSLTPTLHRAKSADAISTHSTPSVSSHRARVNAAKTRSSRASLASLRLPVHSHRASSRPGSAADVQPHPPMEKNLPPLPDMPESWSDASKAPPLPNIERRKSDPDQSPGVFLSQPASVEHEGMEVETISRENSGMFPAPRLCSGLLMP